MLASIARRAKFSFGLGQRGLERHSHGWRLYQAISRARSDRHAEDEHAWFEDIERLRNRLLRDETQLAAWERPWLARSADLASRFGSGAEGNAISMTVAKACDASKPPRWCRLLFTLVRETRPETVVEMGTNIGVSGLYLASALEMNRSGRLVTMEGSPSKAALAVKHFEELGLAQRAEVVTGDFAQILGPCLERVGRTDLAFIDGFHDGPATLRYHKMFMEQCSSNAIIVYDDINWSPAMHAAWRKIRADKDAGPFIDLGSVGICMLKGSSLTAYMRF